MTPKRSRGIIAYLLVAAVLIFLAVFMLPRLNEKKSEYTYSEIMQHFDDLEVTKYTLDLGSGELKLTLKGQEEEITYTVPNVSIFKEETEGYRLRYNKANPDAPLDQDYYKITDNSWIITYIPTFIILVMGIVLFIFMMRQAGGGKYSNFGKANIKAQASNKKATFEDVAGAEEEKFEMAEIVDFLRNPRKYAEIGARIPKGVLLLGPPGTGKTLLARAVAGEAGCPFYPISGSDFVEMFVGVGASRVRDLFETAKKNAPSIVFIDEIDAVGRHRGAGLGGGHDEREQTLNQLLVEMDGFEANESVIVIAATNRRDILDPALLRPGRFDRQIVVGYPDIKGREDILKVHTKNKPLAPDVNLHDIARTTAGFTGADLENLTNEAALLAARADRKAITNKDIAEATIKVVAGPEKKSRVKTEREIKLTAYHEAGHAICTYYCPHQDKVHEISIIPRGMAGGYTLSLPEHDKSYNSKMEMHEEIIVLLGGRVAEKLIMDDISTGASNDLERATSMARSMVTRYGFSEKLGPVVYGHDQSEPFLGRDFSSTPNYSDEVAAEIDAEIRSFVEEGYEKAEQILSEHMDQLHKVAQYLIANEKIDGPDFERLMSGEDVAAEAAPSEDASATVDLEKKSPVADSAMDAYAKDLRERQETDVEPGEQAVQDLTEE
ncbi:MAG: ATP-dependent zinc metalloprotease FtsH [Oscillospiraceae bacterium]|nr:ATP-dependent zinc metalloprotease FtsH [Oscillospiraceae bacterium]